MCVGRAVLQTGITIVFGWIGCVDRSNECVWISLFVSMNEDGVSK